MQTKYTDLSSHRYEFARTRWWFGLRYFVLKWIDTLACEKSQVFLIGYRTMNTEDQCEQCGARRGCSHIQPSFKVIVCGSRKWLSVDVIVKRLVKLPLNTTIIQGECSGADILGKNVARDIGFDVVGFYANWNKYGKAAGPIRNIRMLNTKPELVLAFHDDISKSKGTKHIVGEARKRGIEVEVIRSY